MHKNKNARARDGVGRYGFGMGGYGSESAALLAGDRELPQHVSRAC
jgi:hypothetical protein